MFLFGLHNIQTSELYKTDDPPPSPSLFISNLPLSTSEKGIISHFKKKWKPHINTPKDSEIHRGSFACNIRELRKQNIISQGFNE